MTQTPIASSDASADQPLTESQAAALAVDSYTRLADIMLSKAGFVVATTEPSFRWMRYFFYEDLGPVRDFECGLQGAAVEEA